MIIGFPVLVDLYNNCSFDLKKIKTNQILITFFLNLYNYYKE